MDLKSKSYYYHLLKEMVQVSSQYLLVQRRIQLYNESDKDIDELSATSEVMKHSLLATCAYVVKILPLVPLLSAWAPKGVGGGRGKSKMYRTCKLDIACKHLARIQRTSSTSTRARKVGQGVKKGAKFRIWQQTDFRVICTVVLLIQLHENPQN